MSSNQSLPAPRSSLCLGRYLNPLTLFQQAKQGAASPALNGPAAMPTEYLPQTIHFSRGRADAFFSWCQTAEPAKHAPEISAPADQCDRDDTRTWLGYEHASPRATDRVAHVIANENPVACDTCSNETATACRHHTTDITFESTVACRGTAVTTWLADPRRRDSVWKDGKEEGGGRNSRCAILDNEVYTYRMQGSTGRYARDA